ncbi:MAG: cell wall-binding repeat-containing protein, partial [Actinomycetota bacterium]
MRKPVLSVVLLWSLLLPLPAGATEGDTDANVEVIVVGGEKVISEGVVDHLQMCSNDLTQRIAGSNRYTTASSVAKLVDVSGGTAYVASGEQFPDALAAGAAANATGASLILVAKTFVPSSSLGTLDRIDPDRIVIVGGTAAIGSAVEDTLRARYGNVTRIAGPNRYVTAASISRDAYPGGSDAVIIATGSGYVDALASTPLAAQLEAPLLLTEPSRLPGAAAGELARLKPAEVFIIGGTAVADAAVEQAIAATVPGSTVTRLAGPNRYATARAIVDLLPQNPERVLAVTSTDFPDALAAGAVSGTNPLVLIDEVGLNAVSAGMIESATAIQCEPIVKLGSFTTYHAPGEPRVTNIHLIADDVDGAVVLPDQIFSINEHTGQRTEADGYVAAGAIIGGVIVCCDHPANIGGGTSQFATTLYNAIFYAALEDVYHRPHSIYFTRYPLGVEATLNWTSPDMKFRNDTTWPVTIDASYTSESITVDIWGADDGRTMSHTVTGSATTSAGGEV